ncbi:MAG: MMPL family transporter [Flavobacteriales bacterium]|nr:MMPL family transporter [Flavobacteriales bacterium]
MWEKIAGLTLRFRLPILIALGVVTAFFAWEARNVKLSYKFAGILPEDDSTFVEYSRFVENFSEDGNVIVLGVNDPSLYSLEKYKSWYLLGNKLKELTVPVDTMINGTKSSVELSAIDSVFSDAHCYVMYADTIDEKFMFRRLVSRLPQSQGEVDSIKSELHNLPFYRNLLYSDSTDASLMMVFVNAGLFNSERRGPSIEKVLELCEEFYKETGIEIHISGLPYIRTVLGGKLKSEMIFFTCLMILVAAILLYIFFKSFRVMWLNIGIIIVSVVWSLGIIALFDYPLTMLMSIIPPLMVILGMQNCVFLVNKYHQEFKRHSNKIKALQRTIYKIGNANFLTNATTALGFATFIFVQSDLLVQFGTASAVATMALFVLSMLAVPIVFSFMEPPKLRHLDHLERSWMHRMTDSVITLISRQRRWVYISTVALFVLGFVGMSLIVTTGNIVDDLPDDDRVIKDLQFFETNFNGVMPFEVLIDCGKKGQITKDQNLRKIEELQDVLATHKEFSKSLSIVDATKFAKQAFYNGDSSRFTLIQSNEKSFIGPYFKGQYNTKGLERGFLDSTKSVTRVTTQVADIGTLEMKNLMNELKPQVDSIFDPAKYKVSMTGTSVVFLKGTDYMVDNLFSSILFAIVAIMLIMTGLFSSWRMVLIALVPNLLPLILTAGFMGFFGIALKPSTILVFSIAFSITVDTSIHFLAKYRQELDMVGWNIRTACFLALKDTGFSIVYTSVVLFMGFGVFAASEFAGIQALGLLIAITLVVGMFTNLILLPALLLSLNKALTNKAFKEPFIHIIDEEDDQEYRALTIRARQESERMLE